MKKNLLLAAALFTSALSFGQECTAVAEINEDFSDFTIATSNAFPQNCWNAAGAMAQGPWLYTAEANDNQYAVYYTHFTGANVSGYFIGPELSTIDGNHELAFTSWKPESPNGPVPAGNITVQVGTLTSATDVSTFMAVGEPFTITGTADAPDAFANIIIEASENQKFVAFKFTADAAFNAVAFDNVVWSEVEEPACEAVATLNEGFEEFIDAEFPQNCWNTIATGPMVYTDEDDNDNSFITFYASTFANTDAYLITPEISTFDGTHALSFDARRIAFGPTAPGTVTIQIGTVTGDASTFVALAEGGLFTLTSVEVQPFNNIVIPSAPAGSHIAFRISGDTPHNAAAIDNVVWAATTGTEEFTKASFTLYPNPATGKNVTVALNEQFGAEIVSVFNISGAKVYEIKVNGTSVNLNLDALASGLYVVKVQSEKGTASQKLILQ